MQTLAAKLFPARRRASRFLATQSLRAVLVYARSGLNLSRASALLSTLLAMEKRRSGPTEESPIRRNRLYGGIAYDVLQSFPFQNARGQAPFVTGLSLNGPLNFSDPYANVPGGNPFPYIYSKGAPFPTFPPYQGFYPYQPNQPNTQQQTWSLSVQRQVTPSVFASASYMGTHLIHLWDALELNPALYVPGTCTAGQYGLTAPGPCSQLSNVDQRRL